MTAQDQQSRAEFEALAESLGYDTTDLGHGFCHADTRKALKVWQAARALPAGMEPVGYLIDWPDEPELGHYFAEEANDSARGQALHTAAQVLSMGRVPPEWQAVPVEPTVEQINAAHAKGFFRPLAIPLYDAMLAAAPRPSAAQESTPLIARQLGEWHEDDGAVSWWAWCGREWAGEPAWVGTPNSSDWPGYHTHWTPHPEFPAEPGTKASP